MGATVHPSLVSQIVRHLPGPLLAMLDNWSHRLALRRARQRQQKWLQRKARAAAKAGQQDGTAYQVKPCRD